MIVKDNSEVYSLTKALDSLQPFVDSVYITSTGAKVDQIKALCELRGINYSHFKWCDNFSAARTFNFNQIKEPVDFIWWMDADDILIGGEHLKDVAKIAKDNGKDVVFFTYWYGCGFNGEPTPENLTEVLMEQQRERLLKPGVTVWRKRLHETPVPVSGAKNNYTTYPYDPKERPIVVMHTSGDETLPDKMSRNKRILELELKEERQQGEADPRTLLYLMKIYAENNEEDKWPKVIEMGKEYLTKSGWNEERATCLEQMGIAWAKLGDNQEAVNCFIKAIGEWPHQPLIHIRLATAYFNLKNYSFAKYWMEIGANMDVDNKGSNLTNLKAMKVMYAELLLKLNYNAKRDTKKALEAAKLLFNEAPSKETAEQVAFLEDLDRLNDACGHFDKLCEYLDAIGEKNLIVPILEQLPDGISTQPFAMKLRQKFSEPRRWADNEICYFANFGAAHFEPWSSKSLKSGIGGSETAVIRLSQEWAKLGYKVTVYGDPQQDKGETDGVTWLPWYHFNPRDSFNIFIQWRVPNLAGKIKAKRFLVDLHDIFSGVDYDEEKLNNIDKIMVKSEYHKSLAPNVPDSKFMILGNGI